jgi:hypothetical protein
MQKRKIATSLLLAVGAVASMATEPAQSGWSVQANEPLPTGTLAANEVEHRYAITVELTGSEPATNGELEIDLRYTRPAMPTGNVPLDITVLEGASVRSDSISSTQEGASLYSLISNIDLWMTCAAYPCVETFDVHIHRVDSNPVPFTFDGTVRAYANGGSTTKAMNPPPGTEVHVTVVDVPVVAP